jgi:putative Mg2+ transporter-C (MgtC) family protein
MVGQIVVGVGFIGGGLLFRDGSVTKGINTATTIWCCAAVGAFCGLGRWQEALFCSVVIVLANTILRKLAHQLNLQMGVNDYLVETIQFEVECKAHQVAAIEQTFKELIKSHQCEIRNYTHRQKEPESIVIHYALSFDQDRLDDKLESFVQSLHPQQLISISWRR